MKIQVTFDLDLYGGSMTDRYMELLDTLTTSTNQQALQWEEREIIRRLLVDAIAEFRNLHRDPPEQYVDNRYPGLIPQHRERKIKLVDARNDLSLILLHAMRDPEFIVEGDEDGTTDVS